LTLKRSFALAKYLGMTSIADNPVIAPERELEEEKEKEPGASEPLRIRCPLCGWSGRDSFVSAAACEARS
jgi:hypothetical protein